MTETEIMKALECCGDEEALHWCTECPYYDKENDLCQEDLHRDTIDLLNRKNAEIERLNGDLIIERTRRENAVNAYHEARAEAIKEFLMKAEARGYFPETNDPDDDWEVVSLESLYKIAKEMGVE